MSDRFAAQQPAVHGAVRRLCLCDKPGYRWELLYSADEFQHERDHALRRKAASTVLAIVTKAERRQLKGALPTPFHKHIFSLKQFLHFVAKYRIHR